MSDVKIESEAQIYLEDFLQKLSEIEILILSFADDPTKMSNNLKLMTRIVHSLKGTAGSFGFDLLSIACHKMEDIIATADFTSAENFVDELLKNKDLMSQLSEAYRKNDLPSLEVFRRLFGVSHASSHTPYLTVFSNASSLNVSVVEKRKFKVLICESSKLLSRKFHELLAEFDVEVSSSKDGYEALGRLMKEQYDLFLLSLRVPTIDAMGLITILESIPNPNKVIKSIIVTSHRSLVSKLNNDAVKIIEKGVNFNDELKKTFEEILPFRKKETIKVFNGNGKILIIDDSDEIHKLVKISLKKFPQFTLVHCQDPKLAESLIINEKPNLILLDIQMPEISGEELFMRLQLRGLLKENTVVFLTAMDSPEDIKRLSALGPSGILRKPFSPKLLAQHINEILASKAS